MVIHFIVFQQTECLIRASMTFLKVPFIFPKYFFSSQQATFIKVWSQKFSMDLLNWVLDYWYSGSSRKQTYLGLASYGNVKIQKTGFVSVAVSRPVRLRGCLLGVLSFINSMRSIPLKGQQAEKRWKTENLCSETARKRLLRRLLYKSRGILFPSFRVYSGGSRPSDKERGEGGGGRGEGSPKHFFLAFRALVGLKIRREAGSPGPLPWNRHWFITVALYQSLRASFGFSEPTIYYLMSLSLVHGIIF